MTLFDNINPVALKELRQMVRSRVVVAGLIAMLLISLVATTIVLLSAQSQTGSGTLLIEQDLGSSAFTTIFVIMTILLLYAAPFFIAIRMGMERSNEHLDLQYTTTLTPRQLVDGKAIVAFVMIIFFLSTATPFMALAYLLRGLDLLQALLAIGLLFIAATTCVYEALFLATVATSRIFRVLLIIWMLSAQWSIAGSVIGFGVATLNFDAFDLSDAENIVYAVSVIGGWLTTCLFLRALIIALVAPSTANRAPTVRGWLMVLWLLWGIITAILSGMDNEIGPLLFWAYLFTVLFTLGSLGAISTAPGYSRRVLQEITARGRLRRLMQFIAYSGAENGMLWSLLMIGATVTTIFMLSTFSMAASKLDINEQHDIQRFIFFAITLTTYVWAVRAVWQIGRLQRWLSFKLAWIVAVVLIVLGWFLPYLGTLGGSGRRASWRFGNIFASFEDFGSNLIVESIMLVIVVLFIVFAANLRWLAAAFIKFKPPRHDP